MQSGNNLTHNQQRIVDCVVKWLPLQARKRESKDFKRFSEGSTSSDSALTTPTGRPRY